MLRNVLIILAVALSLLPWCAGCKSKSTAKYRIAVIPKGQTHEFWQSIERGSKAAAADLTAAGIGVEIFWDAPLKESDAQDQIGRVQRNVASRVSGVVLAPQDSKQMVAVVEQAVEKKVPVVIIDSGLDAPKLIVKYVATDNYNGGKIAARHLIDTLARQGKKAPKLVLFRYAVGSESTMQREQGFVDVVNDEIKKQKQAGQPAMQIIADTDYSGPTVDSAQTAAGPMLGRVKDKADGIFAVNESATNGLLNAMRSQDLVKKIVLMGFDSSQPLLRAVEEGEVIGLVVQDPYRMGYLGTWTLIRHLEGDDVGPSDQQIPTGEHLLTKENLDKVETKHLFEPELQRKRKIELPTLGKK